MAPTGCCSCHQRPAWVRGCEGAYQHPYQSADTVASVPCTVRTGRADPQVLAAVRAATNRRQLSADIIRLLDLVWPVLREQNVRTGHNVVVYYPGEGGSFTIEAGVEVFTEFTGTGTTTPASGARTSMSCSRPEHVVASAGGPGRLLLPATEPACLRAACPVQPRAGADRGASGTPG